MSAAWIIEAVNVLEDGDFNGPSCLPGISPNQLGFDGFEEGFHHGVIHCLTVVCPLQTMRRITITLATHALPGSACLHA